MSDRDNTVNGDKSSAPGLSGLGAIIKGKKMHSRQVAKKSKSVKHKAMKGGGSMDTKK